MSAVPLSSPSFILKIANYPVFETTSKYSLDGWIAYVVTLPNFMWNCYTTYF